MREMLALTARQKARRFQTYLVRWNTTSELKRQIFLRWDCLVELQIEGAGKNPVGRARDYLKSLAMSIKKLLRPNDAAVTIYPKTIGSSTPKPNTKNHNAGAGVPTEPRAARFSRGNARIQQPFGVAPLQDEKRDRRGRAVNQVADERGQQHARRAPKSRNFCDCAAHDLRLFFRHAHPALSCKIERNCNAYRRGRSERPRRS